MNLSAGPPTLRPENGCRLAGGKPAAKPAVPAAAAEAEEEVEAATALSAEHYVTILDEATLLTGSIS